MIRAYISWKSKIQYLKVLEFLHLSFIKWPSIQFQFRYLLFFETTIMGKTDLAMVQKTITDTLHKEGQAKLIQKLGRASQGVNWSWSQWFKSHPAQTSSGKELPSHFWNRNIVRSILPGLKRKRTGLLLSGPKSYFQMKVNFAFHLEIRVPESGGRVERNGIHVAWSPVWSFHSQWWFGVLWRLLVVVHSVLSSPKSMQPYTRRFWSTLWFHLLTSFMEMLISFSSRTFSICPVSKPLPSGLLTMILVCLIGQPAWPEPHMEYMGYF